VQQLFLKVAAESSADQIANRRISDDTAEKAIAAKGVVINDVSSGERAKMRDAVKPMYDEYATKYGMADMIKRLLAISSR
jgi:TRAP-type C4-dicarboxylate transport system substrate-binding protein